MLNSLDPDEQCLEFWQICTCIPRVCELLLSKIDNQQVLKLCALRAPAGSTSAVNAASILSNLVRFNPKLSASLAAELRGGADMQPTVLAHFLQLRAQKTIALRQDPQGSLVSCPLVPSDWLGTRQVLLPDALGVRVPATWEADNILSSLFYNPQIPQRHTQHEVDSFWGHLVFDGTEVALGSLVQLTESLSGDTWEGTLFALLDREIWIHVHTAKSNNAGILIVSLSSLRNRTCVLQLPSPSDSIAHTHQANVANVPEFVCHGSAKSAKLTLTASDTMAAAVVDQDPPCVSTLSLVRTMCENGAVDSLLERARLTVYRSLLKRSPPGQTKQEQQESAEKLSPGAVKELVGLCQKFSLPVSIWIDWLKQLSAMVRIPGAFERIMDVSCAQTLLFTLCHLRQPYGLDQMTELTPPELLESAFLDLLITDTSTEIRLRASEEGVLTNLLRRLAQLARMTDEDGLSAVGGDAVDLGSFLASPWFVRGGIETAPYSYQLTPLTHGTYVNPATGEHVMMNNPQSYELQDSSSWESPPQSTFSTSRFGSVCAQLPIPHEIESEFYFEIEILDGGKQNMVAIGLYPEGEIDGMVGWQVGSYGFHGDDGTLRNNTASKKANKAMQCTKGDVMGCGLNRKDHLVYFTRNGKLIGGFITTAQTPLVPVCTGADLATVSRLEVFSKLTFQ